MLDLYQVSMTQWIPASHLFSHPGLRLVETFDLTDNPWDFCHDFPMNTVPMVDPSDVWKRGKPGHNYVLNTMEQTSWKMCSVSVSGVTLQCREGP